MLVESQDGDYDGFQLWHERDSEGGWGERDGGMGIQSWVDLT